MRCVKCGSELKPGARFCSKCGAVNDPAGGGRKQPPGRIQPAPGGYRPPSGGQGGYPPPAPKKEKKPVALIVVLIVLVVCLVLSVGGLAAYKMGVFDSFLSGSRTEEQESKKDRKDRDEDEDDRDRDDGDDENEDDPDRDKDEDDNRRRESGDEGGERERDAAGSRESMDIAESSAALEEPATLPTMDPTTAATQEPTMAQTTAAMPTLAGQGQGTGMGVPAQAPAQGGAPAGGYQDYILPDSSTRSLTSADIAGLSKEQLRIARNEIYARHGRMFSTEELQNYFNSKSWYRGTISPSSFSESMLSQLEKDNIKLIQERENALP